MKISVGEFIVFEKGQKFWLVGTDGILTLTFRVLRVNEWEGKGVQLIAVCTRTDGMPFLGTVNEMVEKGVFLSEAEARSSL